MDEIGVGDSALLCRTNNTGCCGSSFTSFRGEFYYPNSDNIVPTACVNPSFYRNRLEVQALSISINSPILTNVRYIPDDRGSQQNIFVSQSVITIGYLMQQASVPTPSSSSSSKCHFSVLSNNCATTTANHLPTHIIPSNLSFL